MTRLDAQFGVSETFRVGVADFRGDGRPDYFYQASLLYSDTVTPARLSLAGGVTTLNGIGFNPGLQVSVAGNNGRTLSASASHIQVAVPSGTPDGSATIQVTDPVSGAFSQMIGALTYGASATDLLLLLQGAESATAVGSQAANAIRVRAVAADGVTPVSGATIGMERTATNAVQFSACGGASSCSVLSDEAGESSSWVTPAASGPSTITIALAPALYSPPQSQQATVVGTSSALDLVAVTPTCWVGQGATIAVPLTVRALNLGVPKPNVAVNFAITKGSASLSAGSGTTNGSGFATITANLTNQSADVQVSACVAPNNSPCQIFTLFSTPASLWTLETVSGAPQVVPAGQSFQPLVLRLTDGSECLESGDGSGRHFCDHAGSGLGKRNARSPRIVAAAADRDHAGRPRFHRALRRKRGPVRCVYHGERGPIDCASADGEPGSDRYGAADEQPGPRLRTRSPISTLVRTLVRTLPELWSELWFANVPATKRAGGAVRCAARHCEQRSGSGFARERLPGALYGRRFWRSGRPDAVEPGREREICFSATGNIAAGRRHNS